MVIRVARFRRLATASRQEHTRAGTRCVGGKNKLLGHEAAPCFSRSHELLIPLQFDSGYVG